MGKTISSYGTWLGGLTFQVRQDGHKIILDGPEIYGGRDMGILPKQLLLCSVVGCTGMDVVSILGNIMDRKFELEVSAAGEVTDKHPVIFKSILITFHFKGSNLPKDTLDDAIEQSLTKYCGVTAMLKATVDIDYKVEIENREV